MSLQLYYKNAKYNPNYNNERVFECLRVLESVIHPDNKTDMIMALTDAA